MLVDFTAPILGLDGKPIEEKGEVMTLRGIVQMALMANVPEDSKLPGSKKVDFFRLAIEANKGSAELSVKDVNLILERVDQVLAPLAVGRAHELLDPKPAE